MSPEHSRHSRDRTKVDDPFALRSPAPEDAPRPRRPYLLRLGLVLLAAVLIAAALYFLAGPPAASLFTPIPTATPASALPHEQSSFEQGSCA
jgi:hypothetical protein